jgi:hypothetical protein
LLAPSHRFAGRPSQTPENGIAHEAFLGQQQRKQVLNEILLIAMQQKDTTTVRNIGSAFLYIQKGVGLARKQKYLYAV